MGTKEFVLALAIVGAVAWTAKADGPAPVRDLVVKGKLTVAAEDGKGGVELGIEAGSGYVTLRDGAGKTRAKVGVHPNGTVSFNLMGAKSDDRLVALVQADGEASVTAFAPQGRGYADLHADADAAWLTVQDASDRVRVALGILKGEELLHLTDAQGATTGSLGSLGAK